MTPDPDGAAAVDSMLDPALLHGHAEVELVSGTDEPDGAGGGLRPHRLPTWARTQCDDAQLLQVEAQPSGVRLVFDTAATWIELDATRTRMVYPGSVPRPDGVYVLTVDGEIVGRVPTSDGDELVVDLAAGTRTRRPGTAQTVRFAGLPAGTKRVEVWLPWNEQTVLGRIRSDAALTPVPAAPVPAPASSVEGAAARRPVWVHHGSSISQGSNAVEPTGIWPVVAARTAGVELMNLGLGGNALLDPFLARTIRDRPADLISLKLGINLVNTDLMRRRALGPAVHGFLDTIREGHPRTPLLVVTPLLCPVHEATPGPAAAVVDESRPGGVRFIATGDPGEVVTGRLTLQVVTEVLRQVVAHRAAVDPHLHLLDGHLLYGPGDLAAHPLPDDLHPDAETHRLIGARFADLALAPGRPLAH